jgi:hypothetical protein
MADNEKAECNGKDMTSAALDNSPSSGYGVVLKGLEARLDGTMCTIIKVAPAHFSGKRS